LALLLAKPAPATPPPPAAGGQEPKASPYRQLLETLSATADLLGEAGGPTAEQPQEAPAPEPLPGAEPEVRVTEQGTVELHVQNLALATVLQLLSLESRHNIIASPQVSGTVTATLYDVSFDEALNAILLANGAGFVRSGNFIYVYTRKELDDMALAADPPVTRVFPLNYISAADAKTYLTPLLSSVGSLAVPPDPERGVASSPDDAGGNTHANTDFVIVTDRGAHLERIERVLGEIDVRPQQVLIEATILRAQLTEDNALGIDFSVVGGVDLQTLGATSAGIQDLTLGDLPPENFSEFNIGAATDVRSNVPRGGLSVGILKDNVAMFLRALEQVTDTTILANPKVLALNKQRGQVIVGRRDGFLTTTVTETQAIQTVEFLESGTTLIFRPYISQDGFVRVELHPEDSVGFVNAQGLPTKQTTEVTTNVVVRDGHTILIGGLFRDVTKDARSQVPLLGNIPGLGQLFRSNNDSISREEVIILMTLRIVKDDAAYAEAAQQQREDIERMRVGMRRGMMWQGRQRLAQGFYHRALDHYAAGRTNWALWDLRLALHNQPRCLPAIQLKEKIAGTRAWDEDGTAARGFLWNLIARDRGLVLPQFGRPGPPFLAPGELRGPNGFSD